MKGVCILQKYLMPYRVPLFNAVAGHPEIDLTVMYYGTRGERRKSTLYPEKRFRELQSRVLCVKGTYEHNYDFPFFLYRDLKRLQPEVVICAPDVGGLAALLYAKRHGGRYIIWSEGTPLTEARRSPLKQPLRKLIYSHAWRFLVPGSLAGEYIRTFEPRAEVFFANNAIQQEEDFLISESEIETKFREEKLQITFSGSLIERKGVHLLLDAFQRAFNKNFKDKTFLVLLGTGPDNLQIYKSENIVRAGFCEGKKYIEYLKSSHVFILPSLSDPNPLTVIEALFTGNVLVVSDAVGSHSEAVSGNGFVIPTGSAAAIYKILEHIAALPREVLVTMAKRSLALARNFTTERAAAGFLAALLS